MTFEKDINRCLSKWKAQFPDCVGGYSPDEIALAEQALVKPLPAEIRQMYETFTAEGWACATHNKREPYLRPVSKIRWHRSLVYSPDTSVVVEAVDSESEPGWLVFGSFGYGDFLVWCEHYQTRFNR